MFGVSLFFVGVWQLNKCAMHAPRFLVTISLGCADGRCKVNHMGRHHRQSLARARMWGSLAARAHGVLVSVGRSGSSISGSASVDEAYVGGPELIRRVGSGLPTSASAPKVGAEDLVVVQVRAPHLAANIRWAGLRAGLRGHPACFDRALARSACGGRRSHDHSELRGRPHHAQRRRVLEDRGDARGPDREEAGRH